MNEEKIKRYEHCIMCDDLTGRAGRGEDSLYIGNHGPFCESCYEAVKDHISERFQLPPDRWETVKEWEERTGLKYPEEGPVWWRWLTPDNEEEWKHHLYSIRNSFRNSTLEIIVPRIGMGKPPEVING